MGYRERRLTQEIGIAVALAFVVSSPMHACASNGDPGARSRLNLALNRPYDFSAQPSYELCSDPDDIRQLTNGETAGADWRLKSTVGWSRKNQPPYVVMHLAEVEPIDAVRIHTVGGGKAGVFYPANIAVLVSDDGASFHLVGAADSLGIEQNRMDPVAARSTPVVLEVGDLKTRGRDVLILFDFDGDHLFVDEIEVLAGTHDPTAVTCAQANAFKLNDVRLSLPAARAFAEARFALAGWAAAVAPGDSSTLEIVASLRRELSRIALHDPQVISDFTKRIGQARGRWLGSTTNRRFLWERVNPMNPSRPFDLPTLTGASDPDALRRVDVAAWRGEYESAAISLVNCGETDLSVRPVLTPLRTPGGDMLPASDTITLRRAAYVDARGQGRIGDALVRIPDGGFRIEAGQCAQLWLTMHNPALEPGSYHFAIDLTLRERGGSVTQWHEMIQGSLTVEAVQFPIKPHLSTTVWAYVERCDLTKNAPQEAVADLRAHYVNNDVLYWSSCMPMPRVNPDGNVEMRLNDLVDAMDRYQKGEQLLFYWGLGRYRKNVPNLPEIGTPEWKRTMKEWLTKWVDFMKERGVGYDRFVMYPFDEMLPEEFVTLAKFMKEEVDPRIRLFANSRGDKSGDEMSRIAPYIDVWCFRDAVYGARMSAAERDVRRKASAVWSYDVARPAKGKPPLGYYRLQPWRAFARGDTGCGFWTYTDPGEGQGDTWDDFSSMHGKYGVIYGPIGKPPTVDLCGESIVPSRRWEAWREGVEDYEYLTQLRIAIEAAERDGRKTEADDARAVLDQAVRKVLENQQDPARVYEARRSITDALIRLTGHAGANPR